MILEHEILRMPREEKRAHLFGRRENGCHPQAKRDAGVGWWKTKNEVQELAAYRRKAPADDKRLPRREKVPELVVTSDAGCSRGGTNQANIENQTSSDRDEDTK